jgi:hypothetical protein
MGKWTYLFILAVMATLSPMGSHFSQAYGYSLIYGPEFIAAEHGASRPYVSRFSVRDTDQTFMLSLQGGGHSGKTGPCTVGLNSKIIVTPEECGRLHGMLTKTVRLQRQNEISVMTPETANTGIIVSIISLNEHSVNAEIPPVGKRVDFADHASIVFPAGTFDSNQHITIYDAFSDRAADIFDARATGPRLPYEIRINTGDKAPLKDIEVDINIPASFYASPYQIHIFALMHDNPDAPDVHDSFFMISSSVDEVIMSVRTTLPRHAFSTRHSNDGTHEAVMIVGLVD